MLIFRQCSATQEILQSEAKSRLSQEWDWHHGHAWKHDLDVLEIMDNEYLQTGLSSC
jgi:hypothetical protein